MEADGDRLHELFVVPLVYRYLADGVPPARHITSAWIERSAQDRAQADVGLWLLVDADDRIAGCVRTHLLDALHTAELTYVLHPGLWGRGLATRMGWTAMQAAFDDGRIERVIAGTDDPNVASRAVMERLGMRFLRTTRNPRWTGVEYFRGRDDAPPVPVPGLIERRM
jgi:RimJ/RimL family protein N-acetyltransferase